MSEEAEDALTIVGRDGDDALARHRIARISRFASATCHHLVPEVVAHRIGLYVQEGVAHLIALAGGIVYHEAHLGGYVERWRGIVANRLPAGIV